ncbi:MAG TPA: helix-turn-helix domain-containing protein [Panacibacter sp.]|nr:helix-turn-helix domain-containing protein [Panacibacter sp.]
MENNSSVPILFPFDPNEFWEQMRQIIREEVSKSQKESTPILNNMSVPGLTEKPLYKIQEICSLFKVSKPTIYDWVKHGKLRRIKIRSRVFFLGSDIRQLMQI